MGEVATPSPLRGRRILVVEDDYLLAQDLFDELLAQGVDVAGPVANMPGALGLLSSGPLPDMAILDVNLGGQAVFPLADELRSRGVPIVFMTGYDRSALPPAYASVPCCEKPLNMQQLLQMLIG